MRLPCGVSNWAGVETMEAGNGFGASTACGASGTCRLRERAIQADAQVRGARPSLSPHTHPRGRAPSPSRLLPPTVSLQSAQSVSPWNQPQSELFRTVERLSASPWVSGAPAQRGGFPVPLTPVVRFGCHLD